MPQEDEIEQYRSYQTQSREHPDYECEQHTEQYRCLLSVVVCQYLDVDEKLSNRAVAMIGSVFAFRYKVRLHHRI